MTGESRLLTSTELYNANLNLEVDRTTERQILRTQ
jgi:hypothetical protein